jgi:3-oxoacyl-[acyl-carrier protein] reductase
VSRPYLFTNAGFRRLFSLALGAGSGYDRGMPDSPVALITGASRGIGRGVALELAALGTHDLVINYAGNEQAARDTQAACRGAAPRRRVEIVQGDISLAADRERMIGFVREAFGRLDLLVNNAGVAPEVRADILEAGEASFDRLININLKGPYFLTQRAAWLMMAGEALPDFPRAIVNVTSISAFTASVNRGDYCVAKAGLSMMTKLYATRLASEGINVFEIQPGVIATDMTGTVKEKYDRLFAEGLAPINRWGQPSDVGKAVAAIARGGFPYSTGQVFEVDGGFHLHRL